LIEHNGAKLKEYVLKHAAAWKLGDAFTGWLESANAFLSTLVDRIVPGYPRAEAEKLAQELGYADGLLDTGEIFHLWVIEGPAKFAEELPLHKAGLNVIWTDDMTPYRTRKVRILNGAHTACVLASFLGGLDTVGEMMDDPLFGRFIRKAVFDEIVPALPMEEAEKQGYANAVLAFFAAQWNTAAAASGNWCGLAQAVLSQTAFWGQDLTLLPGMTQAVAAGLEAIETKGARAAAEAVLKS
jgi:tagaturonate reductase